MPTLTWVGKDKVVNHHHDVPYRVLDKKYSFAAPTDGPPNTTDNRIIRGDNLEALKSLLPEFEGRVNCIYIDPPYNTGNEKWIYNDSVNDPKIKKWLGTVVGPEGEDFSRHDKWLCMMYPRLKLLWRLLDAECGVLLVSIDDDECHALRFMLDEICGRQCRLATFTWKTDGNFDNQAKIKNCHEYVYMYAKAPELFPHPPVVDPSTPADSKLFRPVIRNTIVKNGPKNPISSCRLPAGFPADFPQGVVPARANAWPTLDSDCVVDDSKLTREVVVSSGWSSLELLQEFIRSGYQPVSDSKGQETRFVLTRTGAVESIKTRAKPSHVITTLSGLGSTQNMSVQLGEMGLTFAYPKPVELLDYLLKLVDHASPIILDSFAGSGTTAHAVLKQNAADRAHGGGNRRFILVEMEDYAETITAERVRRVATGYGQGAKAVAGLGGGFDFYELGERLFDDDGNLNESVGLAAIRKYVAHSENIPLAKRLDASNPYSPWLLGLDDETAWVFYYDAAGITTLDLDFLGNLQVRNEAGERPGTAIIYADRCLLSKNLMTKHGVIFKKIPRDITRF